MADRNGHSVPDEVLAKWEEAKAAIEGGALQYVGLLEVQGANGREFAVLAQGIPGSVKCGEGCRCREDMVAPADPVCPACRQFVRNHLPPTVWRVPPGNIDPNDPASISCMDWASQLAESCEAGFGSVMLVPDLRYPNGEVTWGIEGADPTAVKWERVPTAECGSVAIHRRRAVLADIGSSVPLPPVDIGYVRALVRVSQVRSRSVIPDALWEVIVDDIELARVDSTVPTPASMATGLE